MSPRHALFRGIGHSIGIEQFHLSALVLTTVLVVLSFVNAPYPEELILQHVPTGPALVALCVLILRYPPSMLGFLCAIAFLWLHILGARWIYSHVPYDDWSQSLVGVRLSDCFHWRRNHYDRFVHFASGFLGVPLASEYLQRAISISPRAAAFVAVSVVLSIGAAYEIIEWQLAVHLSPGQAEAYNGQQSDIWDPQKDLAMAGFGSALTAILCLRREASSRAAMP